MGLIYLLCNLHNFKIQANNMGLVKLGWSKMTDLLKLEINGHFYWITRSTLAKYPNFKLALLSAKFEDRNSRIFEHMLDWLRFGKIQRLTNGNVKQLKKLANELNILDLVDYLETIENEFELIQESNNQLEEHTKLEKIEVKDIIATQTQNGDDGNAIPWTILVLSVICSTIAALAFCIHL